MIDGFFSPQADRSFSSEHVVRSCMELESFCIREFSYPSVYLGTYLTPLEAQRVGFQVSWAL